MAGFSRLGEHGAVWLALGALGQRVDERRRARWRAAMETVLRADALNTAVKLLVRRRRPCLPGLPALTRTPTRMSFPSAHAATSFAGALSYANSSLPFTLGVAAGALSLAVFVHLIFAFPNGHLESRAERVLVGLGYPTALLANLTVLPFDSTPTDNCPTCPSNAFLVSDSHTTASALTLFWNCVGGAFMIAAAILLVRRWRASSGPARRVLGPVYVGGLASVLLLAAGFALTELTSAGDALVTVGLIGFISVPYLFLAGLLRTRLARSVCAWPRASGFCSCSPDSDVPPPAS